jgi:hypothetical protein
MNRVFVNSPNLTHFTFVGLVLLHSHTADEVEFLQQTLIGFVVKAKAAVAQFYGDTPVAVTSSVSRGRST